MFLKLDYFGPLDYSGGNAARALAEAVLDIRNNTAWRAGGSGVGGHSAVHFSHDNPGD